MMRAWMTAGVAGLVITASLAWAQGAAVSSGTAEVVSNGSLIHTLVAAPVTGEPYSATQVHETSRTLADGTTIRHKGHHFVARDGEGRVRVEMRMEVAQNGGADTVMVFVSDPVAHTITTFMTGPKAQKVASVVKVPQGKK